MKITRIETQKKARERKSIFVDDAFAAGVSNETLLRAGLRTGDSISPDQLASLEIAEERLKARATAYRFLSTRPRTEFEIRKRLAESDFPEVRIAETIDQLKQSGLINDEDFAGMFVRDALRRRSYGPRVLRRKMALVGLSSNLIEEALHNELDPDTEERKATEAAHKFMKRARMKRLDKKDQAGRAKLGAFLARRGFSWNVISSVFKCLSEQTGGSIT